MVDKELLDLYKDYPEVPYIASNRDVPSFLKEVAKSKSKLVPKRNMIRLENGLLPGHIILLWRISHGGYTTETWTTKYFEYTYGIDAPKSLDYLVEAGYVEKETALESIGHVSSSDLTFFLKAKSIKGLSKMKRADLVEAVFNHFSPEEIDGLYSIRGYHLTDLGKKALVEGQEVVDRHPKKKGY